MINEYAQQQINRIALECKDKQIKIAIKCITYNHGEYIGEALEGFVKQCTNFPFIAIVHDDASTDNTAEILRTYAQKYPDIIKPIYEQENQYSKQDGSIGRIMKLACEMSEAKYIALCEGDDYWTDPHKLQKQVDFLESHPDYTMCFTNAIEHYQDGSMEDRLMVDIPESTIDPYKLYTLWWPIPTASFVLRRELYDFPLYQKASSLPALAFGDLQLAICSGILGKIYFIDEQMSVYRRLNSGAANYLINNIYEDYFSRIRVAKVLGRRYYVYERKKLASKLQHAIYTRDQKLIRLCLAKAPVESLPKILFLVKNKIKKIARIKFNKTKSKFHK